MPELSVTEEQLERIESLRGDLETTFVDGYGHVRRRDAVDYLLDTYTPPAEERVRRTLDRRVRDEGEIDYSALQSVARNTEGVKGSGAPAEEMYAAVFEAKLREAEGGRAIGLGAGRVRAGGAAAPGEAGDAAADADADGTDADASADDDGAVDAVRDAAGVDATDSDEDDTAVDPDDEGDAAVDPDDESDAAAGPDDVGADAVEVDDAGDATDDRTGGPPGDAGTGESPGDARETGHQSAGSAASNGGGSQLGAMMNLLETHDDKWRKAESGDAPYEVDLPDGGTETARTKDDVKRVLFTNY